MPRSLNPYLVNTGVQFPYYNKVSYQGDDPNAAADLDKHTLPLNTDYKQAFKELIDKEQTNTRNYEEPNAAEICRWMELFDKKTGRVDANELQHFRQRLDKYFRTKYWNFRNLSETQKLQRMLAKAAVDVYNRESKKLETKR